MWPTGLHSNPCVGNQDKGQGQQNINNATREHPNSRELIRLNQARRPALPTAFKSVAFTLNPKVEGSNPSRPIETPCYSSSLATAVAPGEGVRVNN
jgi:hypothetical protein